MKTKNHASRATVSKIPLKSSPIFARTIDETANLKDHHVSVSRGGGGPIPNNVAQPGCGQDSSSYLDVLMVPETPMTSTDSVDDAAVQCSGNECDFSLSNCRFPSFDDNGKFYCPGCFYKLALVEVERAQKQFVIAKKKAQLARNLASLSTTQNCGTNQHKNQSLVECEMNALQEVNVDGNANGNVVPELTKRNGVLLKRSRNGVNVKIGTDQHTDNQSLFPAEESRECKRNGAGKRGNAEQEEVVNHRDNNVDVNANGNMVREGTERSGALLKRSCNGKEGDHNDKKIVVDPRGHAQLSIIDGSDSLHDGEQGLVSLAQGQPQPQQKINEDEVMVENVIENELHRQSKGNTRSKSRNSSRRMGAENANPFAEFRYEDPVVPSTSTSELSSGSTETVLTHKDACSVPRKSGECNKSAKHSRNPTIPLLRRKKLPWSGEEEEMLKEAVKAISAKCKKNLSWVNVLEYGHHVFKGNRTPNDVKEKWKRMQREKQV